MNRLQPARAELRYRGFSKTDYVKHDVPETPHYDQLANVGQRWRDLTGYYTRYGDVGELLASVDDRYVIMNAGDELRLAFSAPAPPAPGMARDFVLDRRRLGEGRRLQHELLEDRAAAPAPSASRLRGSRRPTLELEDDPVYRQHARDWQTYHTRFVTPRAFLGGLR